MKINSGGVSRKEPESCVGLLLLLQRFKQLLTLGGSCEKPNPAAPIVDLQKRFFFGFFFTRRKLTLSGGKWCQAIV